MRKTHARHMFTSAYFVHSLRELSTIKKNVAANTLIKLVQGNVKGLYIPPRHDKDTPRWQMTALKGHEKEMWVVWCAKDGGSGSKPIIEAHCAGSNEKCLNFRDKHPALPKGAVLVKVDLSGIENNENTLGQSQDIELAWTLNKSLGDAILDKTITELPKVSQTFASLAYFYS